MHLCGKPMKRLIKDLLQLKRTKFLEGLILGIILYISGT